MHNARRACLPAALLLIAACGPADDVRVQPLPSLAVLSAEARAGVPTVSGVWRFAGWEVAEGDSASLQAPLPGFGAISLNSQKRDSLGGSYLLEGGRAPLAGEVRRDSVLSLVTFLAPGDGRFLAGTLARDTFWMEMSSLAEPGRWPRGARAAFVRTPVAGSPFLRMRGALPPAPPLDSAALDSINAAAAAAAAAAAPVTTAPPATTSPVPQPTAPAAQPAAPAVQPPAARPPAAAPRAVPDTSRGAPRATPKPQPATPRPQPAAPPRNEPEPIPADTQREPPHLLGVPVQRDTTGDGTATP
jgi:hypothetical protein